MEKTIDLAKALTKVLKSKSPDAYAIDDLEEAMRQAVGLKASDNYPERVIQFGQIVLEWWNAQGDKSQPTLMLSASDLGSFVLLKLDKALIEQLSLLKSGEYQTYLTDKVGEYQKYIDERLKHARSGADVLSTISECYMREVLHPQMMDLLDGLQGELDFTLAAATGGGKEARYAAIKSVGIPKKS